MAVTSTIMVDGHPMEFRASAATPRLYRNKFGRDIMVDFSTLIDEVNANDQDASRITLEHLEMFENIAWTMSKQADAGQPDSPDEWLDQFDIFSIYDILPELIKLWNRNQETMSEPKKKAGKP